MPNAVVITSVKQGEDPAEASGVDDSGAEGEGAEGEGAEGPPPSTDYDRLAAASKGTSA
jgi:hypothetical protein